ncbi:MAG TPA: MBL fold metallo-hydrolase [Alphaproteobacteria bacterium]|nr:MBL fold metallo-hydrolase [Alphaproteobacteria bacterium]
MKVQHFYDKDTATFTYVISDSATNKCAIIDPVLDYDMHSGKSKTTSADIVIKYIQDNDLQIEWILETHIHADHLTSSSYIKEKLGGKIGIGENIKEVLNFWVPMFNSVFDTPLDGKQFDKLFKDCEKFNIGNLEVKVIHTPGHTPACLCYHVENSIFVGDTIFTPALGTARTDFPGGSAKTLYNSIQKILALPDETKIYVGHDYPAEGKEPQYVCTVKEQKESNILVNKNITEEQYIETRNKRDFGKAVPRLLLPSIQVNLRVGKFGKPEENGIQYIKVPVNKLG